MKFFVSVFYLVAFNIMAQTPDFDKTIEEASLSNDFPKLEVIFTEIVNSGDVNVDNYLSLASASLKNMNLGKARLNVEKAFILAPHNIEVLNLREKIIDEINSDFVILEEGWIKQSFSGFVNSFSPITWLIVNVITLIAFLIGALFILGITLPFGKKMSIPWILIVSGLLFALSLGLGLKRENSIIGGEGVVALEVGTGKISASSNSPDAIDYKGGDLFRLLEEQGEWSKVMTSDFEELWIETRSLGFVAID